MADVENEGPSDRVLVRAGPGTGRTHVLEQRTLNLLLRDGVDPRKIAYFNSSEKGVQNFKRTLARKLSHWLESNDEELAKSITSISGRSATQELIARARSQAKAALKFGETGICIQRIGTPQLPTRQFDHIMIDDGDQLSEQQWETITGLTAKGGSGDERQTIFAVGNEKQSIFSFRGPDEPIDRVNLNRLFHSPLDAVNERFSSEAANAPLMVGGLVIPERTTTEGILIKSASVAWAEIAKRLKTNWSLAYQIPPEKWEEMIAGAYSRAGFDEVILTPRSGDYGRDVIAIRKGIGCIKIIGSVKAYKPGHLVSYDDVRALAGVLLGERDASKGIITTTSDFPPRILSDPILAPLMPTRLELMNGTELQKWLAALLKDSE